MAKAVIRVESVSKNFILPHQRTQSIKSAFTNLFKNRDDGRSEVQHALRDISFDIREGEFFGILGRNGSGKSTLLKMLAGIYSPSSGKIETEGKIVPFIELGVGFNPELTGRENVYLNGAMLGFSKEEIDAQYDDIVKFAELERFMDQKLKNYSSGMQVRLAFSVAIQADADILIVDEVLAVGDADFQRKCFDYFKALKQKKKTVVFVTHDMSAVREYCERAILIKDGLIAYEDKASKIADEYLKLFNQDSEDSDDSDSQSDRWGNGQVKISNFSVKVRNDTVTINTTLTADRRGADDVVFGYRFLNSEGQLILGGNSLNAINGNKLNFEPNEKKKLTFTMPDIFGSGSFSVGATVRLSDKITFCDNWDNIVVFRTTKDESYYPVVAPAEMEIS